MEGMATDLRGGLRALWKHRVVSGLAVLSLGLAIGGNTAVFSVISAMFLRPLPFEEPDRLAFVSDPVSGGALGIHVDSAANFLDLRRRSGSFEDLVAFRGQSLGIEGDGEPEPVAVMEVSDGFFRTLGWSALRGQLPSASDHQPGAGAVAVLSHRFWTGRFGADEDMLGSDLELSGEPYRIVGVLPPDAEFLSPGLQVFSPLRLDPAHPGPRGGGGLSLFGRLADGVTVEQADREMATLASGLEEEHPVDNASYSLGVVPIRDRMVAPENRQLMAALQVALVFVLLIACANVANLLLAQGQRRRQELAVRSAMGAGRRRIVAQLLMESVALAGVSLLFGVALGWASIRALRASLQEGIPDSFAPRMEPGVILFTIAVAAVSALLFGLLPALRTSRTGVGNVLREGGRGDSSSRRWLAKSLVVGQIALSMALLAGTAMLMSSLHWMQFSSPGFDSRGLLTLTVRPPTSRYPDATDLARFYDTARERVEAVPGVRSASFVSALPRSPFNPRQPFTIEGRAADPDEDRPEVIRVVATPGYFRTLDLSTLRGRTFSAEDRADARPVLVVNRTFAEQQWPGADALGRRVVLDEETRTVVGVVPDIWQELLGGEGANQSPVVFVPHAQVPSRGMNLLVRAEAAPEALGNALRAALWEVDPRLSLPEVLTFEEYIGQFFGTESLGPMLAVFAGLALLLAAIGVYGILAFSVARRTREIGLRMAMGADRVQILRLFGMEGLRLLLLSLLVGGPLLLLVTLGTRAALSGLAPVDPVAGLPRLVLLVMVVLAAALVPALRAARMPPNEALQRD